ncbi:14844_t:CDS:2 [Cetraspora pellucida]|uniref:14844_t:CDS:1 n=1 Tax=Cetraspora pellucida TaxID=1433469 RepID=A0A9N9B9H2_9GLOM|nr:14844_t:CDS:2 [Cetraspora pellucida]
MDPSNNIWVEIPQTTNYWMVFLSFCISVLGMITTLELLGKRSSQSGSKNWLRLIGAAFSNGFVGIWGMHFIGMRACMLSGGRQLRYNLWYTILSLIIPIVVLSIAFYSIGAQPQVNLKRILLGGTIAGSSIGTAMIMAVAVCGMHYTAYAGTHYYDNGKPPVLDNFVLNDNLVLGSLGCLVACVFLLSIGIYTKRTELFMQKIALGAAIYNEEGMVLVSVEGLLPLIKIGDNEEFHQLSLEDEIFHSIYQISNDWETVNKCLPYSDETKLQPKRKTSRSTIFIESFMLNARQLANSLNIPFAESGTLYDQILFTGCDSSSAKEHLSLEKTNLNNNTHDIHDIHIMSTSSTTHDIHTMSTSSTFSSMYDCSQPQTLMPQSNKGKGQILFIVKQIKSSENIAKSSNNNSECSYRNKSRDKGIVENFQKLGFRFASPRFIAPIMAQKVGISVRQMQNYLENMFLYSNSGLKPFLEADSVYVGLFVTKNDYGERDLNSIGNGLEILVMENYRHQIPVSKLPTIKTLGKIEMDHIKSKEGIHLNDLILQLRTSFLGAISNLDLKRVPKNHFKSNKSGYKQNSVDHLKDNVDSLNLTTQQNNMLEGFRYELMQSLHRLTHIVSEEQLYANAKLVPQIFDILIPTTSSDPNIISSTESSDPNIISSTESSDPNIISSTEFSDPNIISSTKSSVHDIISSTDTNTTQSPIKQKFAKLIIFYLTLPANVKPKLSRGEVCFLPFGMFEAYQNVLYYNSKRFGKCMPDLDKKQNKGKKEKRTINNDTSNNKISSDSKDIENDEIEVVVENKPTHEDFWTYKHLLSLLQSRRLSKDIRQNDHARTIDEKRWYNAILEENYTNDAEIKYDIETIN